MLRAVAVLGLAAFAASYSLDPHLFVVSGREPRSFVSNTQSGPDFLVNVAFDENRLNYSTLAKPVDVPPPANTHNEPYDAAVSHCGNYLVSTNLLASFKQQGDFFVWDVSNVHAPMFHGLVDVPNFGCANEVHAYKDGFLIAFACDDEGDEQGTIVYYDPAKKEFMNFLQSPRTALTNEGSFSVNTKMDSLIVASLVVPLSLIETPEDGTCIAWRNTIQHYNLGGNQQWEWTIKNARGFWDVKHIPHDTKGRAVTAAQGTGILYLLEHGKPAIAVFDLNMYGGQMGFQIKFTTHGHNRAIVTVGKRYVLLMDFSNPELPTVIDSHDFGVNAGTYGVKFTADEKRAVVVNYGGEWDDLSKVVHFGGKRSVHVFQVEDGAITLDTRFNPDFHGLMARPSAIAFKYTKKSDSSSSSSSDSSMSDSYSHTEPESDTLVFDTCKPSQRKPDHHKDVRRKVHLAKLQGKAQLANTIHAGECDLTSSSSSSDDSTSSWRIREIIAAQKEIDIAYKSQYMPRAYGKLAESEHFSSSGRLESSLWSDSSSSSGSSSSSWN